MLYYGKSAMLPIRMWDSDAHDDDHFQMTIPLTGGHRILLVLYPAEERARCCPHSTRRSRWDASPLPSAVITPARSIFSMRADFTAHARVS